MEGFFPTNWLSWIGHFLVMVVLWFLFASKVEPGEILVGIAGAALAAVGDRTVRRRLPTRFQPRIAWLLEVWRLPGYALSGTVVIFKVLISRLILLKEPQGLLRSVPFDPGGETGRASARRALALVMTTFPPNFIVVGIDKERKSMLVHQIEESDVPEVTKRLGAK
jgi:multisubunit Na+/H+ antiporter MnhE subunit